jgi:hypothetical protein
MRWFEDRSGLSEPSFVVIGEEWLPDWEGQENLGCTFPRLVVGRSRAGSLLDPGSEGAIKTAMIVIATSNSTSVRLA